MQIWRGKEKQGTLEPSVPDPIAKHAAWLRLEEQLAWYERAKAGAETM